MPHQILARTAAAGLATMALALGGCSMAQSPAAGSISAGNDDQGYLDATSIPDTIAILGAPPRPGSPRQMADTRLFEQTRVLRDTPRWQLAQRDADNGAAALLADFDCAIGVHLDARNAPALAHLFARVRQDSSAIIKHAKDHYRRPRPFVGTDQPICTPGNPDIIHSTSYPSGHSTRAWTYGLILAELVPDRATQIMTRARIYGDSRIVCGVHYQSDVEAGRSNGAVVVTALHANSSFMADMAAAKVEIAAARRNGVAPDTRKCAADDEAVNMAGL